MDQRLPFERFQTLLMLDKYYGRREHVEYLIASHAETVDRSLVVPAQYKGNCCAVLFLYWLEMGLQTYEPMTDELSRWHLWGKDSGFDPEAQEIDRDGLRAFLETQGLPLPDFWLYRGADSTEAAPVLGIESEVAPRRVPTLGEVQRLKDAGWTFRKIAGHFPAFFGYDPLRKLTRNEWDVVRNRMVRFLRGEYKGNKR